MNINCVWCEQPASPGVSTARQRGLVGGFIIGAAPLCTIYIYIVSHVHTEHFSQGFTPTRISSLRPLYIPGTAGGFFLARLVPSCFFTTAASARCVTFDLELFDKIYTANRRHNTDELWISLWVTFCGLNFKLEKVHLVENSFRRDNKKMYTLQNTHHLLN